MKKYFLKNKKEKNGAWIGELYVLSADGKNSVSLVEREYKLTAESDRDIKFSIIIQKIAEGHSLKTILESSFISWAPTVYEFFLWVDGSKVYRNLFHKAKVLRSQGMIEVLFQQIESLPETIDKEALEQHLSILRQISKALEKEVENEDVNLIDIHVHDVSHMSRAFT